jgi:hypothetical protein
MPQIVNGRVVEVPTLEDGSVDSDALRRAARIPRDRPLIIQRRDGRNVIVNPGQKMRITPGDFCTDAPKHDRGARMVRT